MAEREGKENTRGSTKMPGAFLNVRRTARRAKTMDVFRNPSLSAAHRDIRQSPEKGLFLWRRERVKRQIRLERI